MRGSRRGVVAVPAKEALILARIAGDDVALDARGAPAKELLERRDQPGGYPRTGGVAQRGLRDVGVPAPLEVGVQPANRAPLLRPHEAALGAAVGEVVVDEMPTQLRLEDPRQGEHRGEWLLRGLALQSQFEAQPVQEGLDARGRLRRHQSILTVQEEGGRDVHAVSRDPIGAADGDIEVPEIANPRPVVLQPPHVAVRGVDAHSEEIGVLVVEHRPRPLGDRVGRGDRFGGQAAEEEQHHPGAAQRPEAELGIGVAVDDEIRRQLADAGHGER